jgi:hypothetical protein
LSEQFFELYLSRLPVNGSADEAWMKGAIDFTQKSLGGAEKDIPTKQSSISVSCKRRCGDGRQHPQRVILRNAVTKDLFLYFSGSEKADPSPLAQDDAWRQTRQKVA